MSDTRNTSEYVWEEEGWKRNEKTYTKEERGGNGWETLYGRELGGEVWAREFEETLKSLRGDRREMKERECGLKQEDILDRHIIKSRKEELGNEKGKEGGKPHREFKENYKNESREKLEVNTGQKEIKWGNENQGQLGRQERQKNSGEEQEDWSKADGATHREKEIREAVAAQAWEKELCQEGSGDGFQKWPVDISERQRRKTQEEKVLRKETLKGEHGQKSLPIQPQELLIRSGENQQENDSLSEEVLTAWGSENKEEAHSASHLCELVNVTEELTHADVVGPGNGLNNEGTQMEVSQRWMRLSRSRKEILPWELQESICIAAWAPLDLPSLVMECHLVPKQKLFWKVLLILPGYDTCFARSPTRVLMDWLKVKFMGIKDPPQNGASWSNDKVETLCTLKSQRQKWNLAVDINICVKVMHGVCTKEQLHKAQTQGSLLALSGLILLLPTRRRGIGQDGYWHLARLRLSQLLRAKPSQPLVPLVILVPTDRETLGEEEAKAGLRLRDLITSRVISYFSIFRIPCYIQDLEGSNQVQEAVRWLVCYSPPVAELCCETFTHFIEKGINCEFRERLSRDQKDRQLAGLPSQEPALILELYNSVIQFLAGVMSAKQLCGPSGLAPEFFQLNDPRCLQPQGSMPEYLEWLRTITLSLQLPPIVLPQKTNWQCTCSSILKYVYHLFGSHASYPLLQCQVEHLLSQAYCHWWTKDSGEQEEPSGTEVPWDVIICLCVQQLLQNWSPPRQPGTPEAIDQQGREIQVCYFKDSLREYCLPSSWENPRLKTRNEML
uniref:Germinal-center associated nuclear protein-like n=1 Tax=Monodelphis domestica TaxID=13616 RepID=A0A5F8G8R5_MONDO